MTHAGRLASPRQARDTLVHAIAARAANGAVRPVSRAAGLVIGVPQILLVPSVAVQRAAPSHW